MSKDYVVIKSARSLRRYRAKGYSVQAWRLDLGEPRRSMFDKVDELQFIRGLFAEDLPHWEVRAYSPVVKDEDMRFAFYFSDCTEGINPKTLSEAATFHEGARPNMGHLRTSWAEAKQKLRSLPVGGKLTDWDNSYIIRTK